MEIMLDKTRKNGKASPEGPLRGLRWIVQAFLLGISCFIFLSSPATLGYQESPMLEAKVSRGELPAIEERLPRHPAVVEPVHSTGQYGGTWRRLTLGHHDMMLTSRMGYEPIVRWDRSGTQVVPGFAESWEILDEGKTYVFHLREGMKWSDGHPFTSEDILFWFEDCMQNKELTPVFPSWLTIGNSAPQVQALSPTTVVFRFQQPYGIFLEVLAFQGFIVHPKHYLKDFHPRYKNKEEIEKLAKTQGLDFWYQLFGRMAYHNENPDLPTWRPFQLKTSPPAQRYLCERNPFYWKVDPQGNQLPYIDAISFLDMQNSEIITLKAMAGEVDFQSRRIDSSNYTLFMENRTQGGYRVQRDLSPTTITLYLNQHSKDPSLRPILQDKRFRIALSLAIHREELNFLMFSNMAVPSRGVASPYDAYYLPEFDQNYLEYDPQRAESLLDEVGLLKGKDGMRRMPDGSPFRQLMHVFPSEEGTGSDLWQLVADYFREVGLDFVVQLDSGALSRLQVCNGNSDFWAYAIAGMNWIVDPMWYVPYSRSSYFAPLYGRYVASAGKDQLGVKPPPEFQRLLDWYEELFRAADDQEKRLDMGHNILRQWSEACYAVGISRRDLLTIVSNRFYNVPDRIIHDYRIMTPGYIGIEQFYMTEE